MDDLAIPTDRPVCVTGASGYLAGWIVRLLLEAGGTVHGTVRDADEPSKTAHLYALAKGTPGTLKLFEADLLDGGSFLDAVKDCTVVFHTASPFASQVGDPQADLVDPAVKGTINVLETCNQVDSVERVVLTSSVAACYCDNRDLAETDTVVAEERWNDRASLDHQPYALSKTLAERKAWEMADAQDRWRLVTVNPAFIVGPGADGAHRAESFDVIARLARGDMRFGAPDLSLGAVDVRDVAEVHVRAAFAPAAQGRHVTFAQTATLLDMGAMLRARLDGGWPLPKGNLPKPLLKLVGPLLSRHLSRRAIDRNVGWPWRGDNTKVREELGMTFRDIGDGLADMVRQMVASGRLKAR